VAVESAADLLGMFDADEFAVTATWISRDGGPGVADVPVLFDLPESTTFSAGGGPGLRAAAPTARVPASALPGRPVKGDLFAVADDGDYKIAQVDRDPLAPIWLLTLVRA
jgi:hypothetical protein